MSGVAAVRVPPLSGGGADTRGEQVLATSPDMDDLGMGGQSLLWYALGPSPPDPLGTRASFDPASRLLTLTSGAWSRVLTAAGFEPGGAHPGSPAERQAARDRAFTLLREASRREATGFPADAIDLAREASARAGAAGDAPLGEWATRLSGRFAIEAGRLQEGERELAALTAVSGAAPNLAWELARALHLAGDLRRALRWYGWGRATGSTATAGSSPRS